MLTQYLKGIINNYCLNIMIQHLYCLHKIKWHQQYQMLQLITLSHYNDCHKSIYKLHTIRPHSTNIESLQILNISSTSVINYHTFSIIQLTGCKKILRAPPNFYTLYFTPPTYFYFFYLQRPAFSIVSSTLFNLSQLNLSLTRI